MDSFPLALARTLTHKPRTILDSKYNCRDQYQHRICLSTSHWMWSRHFLLLLIYLARFLCPKQCFRLRTTAALGRNFDCVPCIFQIHLCDSFYTGCPKKCYIISQASNFGDSFWKSLRIYRSRSRFYISSFIVFFVLFSGCVLAVHILNTCEIDPIINLWDSTPKLFDFIELDLVVAFKMMSHFSGQPVWTYWMFYLRVLQRPINTWPLPHPAELHARFLARKARDRRAHI